MTVEKLDTTELGKITIYYLIEGVDAVDTTMTLTRDVYMDNIRQSVSMMPKRMFYETCLEFVFRNSSYHCYLVHWFDLQ